MTKKILYPFLFALFPILSLTAYNIRQIFPGEITRPLLFSILFSIIVLGVAYLLTRDSQRSALITVLVTLLFFSYGQIYSSFEGHTFLGLALFRHRVLLPSFGILGLLGVLWLARTAIKIETFTYGLNLISIFLLIYPTFTIAYTLIQQSITDYSSRKSNTISQQTIDQQPDVYYIILDGYGRQDVLEREYGFDNSEFINALRQRGFYIGECSQSNYGHTLYSLSSSLNYDYLDSLGTTTEAQRIAVLKHGAVRSTFESLGYQIVAFPTGWSMTEWTDADIYPDYGKSFTTLTEFETLFLDTTLLRVALDYDRSNSQTTLYSNARRMRVLSMLETLKELPGKNGKYFVFAHFVIPHPPYSFGPNGEWIEINTNKASYDEISRAYISQIMYINDQILQVVDTIQSESATPPVIIIQGDHGPPPDLTNSPGIRMPILNAYYLPDANQELYPSISPVNSFRVVLNHYFGMNLPLLEDKSYFAPNSNHEKINPVPNYTCPAQ